MDVKIHLYFWRHCSADTLRIDIIINATISNKLNVSECDDKKKLIQIAEEKRKERLWGRSIISETQRDQMLMIM